MTSQHIVDPDQVEAALIRIWEGLAKEKMRACLFNLIVFNNISTRTDYIRRTVQKVSEKYPCRVLFITYDPGAHTPYLKTAVSVVGDGNIACDYIDIGVSGAELEKVPFILLPHLIPDLPVSLLWTEDPNTPHPLFDPLAKYASRVIFDSESADSLFAFAKKVVSLQQTRNVDIADLNWARIEGWRDLIASLFHANNSQIQKLKITYNAHPTQFFCHLKVQSLYLLFWLSSRLKWKLQKTDSQLQFSFEQQSAEIAPAVWEKLGPGTITAVELWTQDGRHYHCERIPTQYHTVTIRIASPELCELPSQFFLGRTATGQSLVKEIITKGTSLHYLEMLQTLITLDKDLLC